MLSAPPAITTDADPVRMRSAANAIAWSPDAQKRLTVTADASTGMPARKLAIRAIFSPCSASGMAQPRITSSTSDGAMPGDRFSVSARQTAARSSGRVERSDPDGALPTAVRTAETMTASAIVVLQEIFDGLADFHHFPIEQMVCGVDDHKLFRLGKLSIKPPYVFQRTDLVSFSVNKEGRLGCRNHIRK